MQECQARVSPLLQWVYYMQRVLGAIWKRCLSYTRRRMTQASKASVDEVLYVPAALALHQRPGIPGIRSTFGTGTELLNSLRLMYSRLSNHRCPNGHYLKPSLAVAAGKELVCSEMWRSLLCTVGRGVGIQFARCLSKMWRYRNCSHR